LQIKSTNSDVLYHINPNKDWQTHFNFSIALRVDRFYVQSINRKIPPSSTSMRKSRRNVCATQTWVKNGSRWAELYHPPSISANRGGTAPLQDETNAWTY